MHSNQFMGVVDPRAPEQGTDKTFGFDYFDELALLVKWSKQQKTHLDIFGRFMQYTKELEGNLSLRLFPEVLVVNSRQQEFQ
jgi:hypothetical protein